MPNIPKSFIMSRRFCAVIFILPLLFISLLPAYGNSVSWDEKYSDEAYTYLLIERTIEIKRDWSSQETTRIICRVQKEGAKSLGEIPIDYDRSFQELRNIKAVITTPDGRKLSYKSIQDLNPYSGEPLYSDSRTKVITMPNVVPGSIIDWRVTTVTKKPIIKDTFWDILDFTSETPVKSFTYKLIVYKNMPIKIMNHNADVEPVIEAHGDKIIYTWKGYLDKFEPEEYMPAYDDFSKYTMISNIKDWKDIAAWYWGLVNENLKASEQIKKIVSELIKDKERGEDKVQAIIEYMQENFRYVSMSFGYHRYEPHPSDEVFNNKYGDCKDQTLVFMAMLKEAGIASYPALYCDEDSGNPKDKLPMPAYFNHAILGIDLNGKIYYTDILQKGYLLSEVPSSLEGGYIFAVNDKDGFFGQLPALDESEKMATKETKIDIREDGSALVEQVSIWPKDTSISFRQKWKNMTDKEKREFFESLDEAHTAGGKMLQRNLENIDTEYKNIKSVIKYENPRWTVVMGEFMIFGGADYERNTTFSKEKRNYPIMIRSNSLDKETFRYLIPEGFELVNLPRDIHLKTEFAEFSRTFKSEGREISETEVKRYKRALLPASKYDKVKAFYNELSQLTKEKIIIKKKEQ